MIDFSLFGLGLVIGLLLGVWYGKVSEAFFWRAKADDTTPIHSGRKFFYVMHSADYCERVLKLQPHEYE
jgi:hypothetical protein